MKSNLIKNISLLMVIIMICMIAVSCGKKDEHASDNMRNVVDMTGETIEIPANIEKIFVDWASGITLATTLGITDKLVCVPTAFETETFAWTKIICPAIDSVKKDDDAYTNAEVVLTYEPDLVITNTADNIATYQNLGLNVIYVTFNNNDTFKESLKIVGAAVGEKEYKKAEKFCNYFDANVKMVENRLNNVEEDEKQTIYYVDGRFEDPYHTVGRGEIQEEWISIAGGILATANEFEGRNLEMNPEKMLEINPDIILVGAQKQAEAYQMLMSDSILSELDAIKNGTVYRIPQGLFPWCRTGPEASIQMIWAAKLLYPTVFEDININEVAKDFYKEFYDISVNDDVIEGILSGRLSPNAE